MAAVQVANDRCTCVCVQEPCMTRKRKTHMAEIDSCNNKRKCTKCCNTVPDTIACPLSWTLEPVLSDAYHRKVETEQMYIGKITEKKETSRLLKEMCKLWPLTGKKFLKRVRWTSEKNVFEIVIRPVDELHCNIDGKHPLKSIVGDAVIDTTGLSEWATVHPVPKFPPLTSQQYEKSVSIWPVQFRTEKYVEKILNDDLFSLKEKETMKEFMKMSVDAAQHGKIEVGAVVVDPSCNRVVAVAHDLRHVHPLQHAAMVAIDLVAKSQGGDGGWNIDSSNVFHLPSSDKEFHTSKDTNESQENSDAERSKKSNLPYLCTTYDVYITREPCVILHIFKSRHLRVYCTNWCSMALVHSRIRRVFYGCATPWGGLGSHYKIHIQPELNHHFEVWKGLLRDECQKLKIPESKVSVYDAS